MADGFVIDGQRVVVPGCPVVTYLEDPRFAMSREDGETRGDNEAVDSVGLHTTTGNMPQKLLPGAGPVGDLAERNARYWSTSAGVASAHLIVDLDGTWVQVADLLRKITYHAGHRELNHRSFGIEIAIPASGNLYEAQLKSLMALLDFVTRFEHPRFRIFRQYAVGQWPMAGIGDYRGIFGHRDVGNRGEGDPGPLVYNFLQAAKYDAVNVPRGEHKSLWQSRQAWLNQQPQSAGLPPLKVDGDPGGATWARAKLCKPHGQWVSRPGD
jgi:hypothetical protein